MRDFLKKIHVIQVREYKNALGYTYRKQRLNKWNPFTYLTIVLTIIMGLFMFGFVGIWKEMETGNPFKWR